MEPSPSDVLAGQAVYNRWVLAGYDIGVLGLSCRLVWRCPKAYQLANYQRNVGERHLELGTGTAYFLDHCAFPTQRPEVTLVDLNPTVLRVGAARIARYRPGAVRADVLQPLPFGTGQLAEAGGYDSVGMNFLLHCVPGTWARKGQVFANAAAALRPGGRLFGSTILGAGVAITPLARRLMRLYNSRGIFHNSQDDLDGLREQIDRHFPHARVTVRGCVAVFEASDAPLPARADQPAR
ncbi:class I SAM-dependent methyltransferase [Micromonospora sp. NPDC049559]|uniref:class I SAM-dependent methyltransferase n=1 Tax=Micromonospora sp. NPDC049559 TaxID=3155923 RepID=UPI0034276ADE